MLGDKYSTRYVPMFIDDLNGIVDYISAEIGYYYAESYWGQSPGTSAVINGRKNIKGDRTNEAVF